MSKSGKESTAVNENVASEEEIIILTGESCPPCDGLKKALDGQKTQIKCRFVDVNSEEGQAIIKEGTEKLELPIALRVKKTVHIEECEIFHDGTTVLIKAKDGSLLPLKET